MFFSVLTACSGFNVSAALFATTNTQQLVSVSLNAEDMPTMLIAVQKAAASRCSSDEHIAWQFVHEGHEAFFMIGTAKTCANR